MPQTPKKERKLPSRRCVGCMEHFPKQQLCRVVRTPEGEIRLDATGKAAGRGAYLCRSVVCLQKAKKAKRLENALDCPIPEGVYARLEQKLQRTEDVHDGEG